MTGPKMHRVWTFVSVLMLALVVPITLPSHAWGRRLHHGGHIGKHQHHHRFHHSGRTDFHHRRYHHHRHHDPRSSFFLGLGFYGYPYPYDYPYYGTYTPGDHRRFPASRLPGFFHYPGAIGKGEDEGSVKP